jgi:predicted deacetylase
MNEDIVKRLRANGSSTSFCKYDHTAAADYIESLRMRLTDSLEAEEYIGLQRDKAERRLAEAAALLRDEIKPYEAYLPREVRDLIDAFLTPTA